MLTPPDSPSPAAPENFRAPNGLEIFHHAAAETKYVYQGIFEGRAYIRHGITVERGELIVDVGANIGSFTIFMKKGFNACFFKDEKRPSGSGIVDCCARRR